MDETMSEIPKSTEGKKSILLTHIECVADISGLYARVTVRQEYKNLCSFPVEAVYVFPMPEEASVTECFMQIGEKEMLAELKAREEARREYNEAVRSGHHASLLEQKRTNIFTMNVGGIEPGEDIRVSVIYQQRVFWQQGGGRFTLPFVVAPRFIPGAPKGKTGRGWSEDTDAVPDASEITPVVAKEGVPYTAEISVNLTPGFSCRMSSPSHSFPVPSEEIGQTETKKIHIENLTPDRDFILCYKNTAESIQTAAHLGSFSGEEFALLTIVPEGTEELQPSDFTLCLDCSGSMNGPKIEGLKVVAEKVVRILEEQNLGHRVAVVPFSSSVLTDNILPLSPISPATYENLARLNAGGGTRAGEALHYCFNMLRREEGARPRYILFVSDGQTEDTWTQVVPGVRVVAVGIDVAANLAYIRDIARATGGSHLAIYPGEDYDAAARTLTGLLSGPVLRDIHVTSGGKEFGEVVGLSDVYHGMPALLAIRTPTLPEECEIAGKKGGDTVHIRVPLLDPKTCGFAHKIWAREKLRTNVTPEEQLAVSLKYGVLSSRTAFVAVHLKEIPGAKPERIEIPVSLPHTWDYDAVFGGMQLYAFTTGAVRTRGAAVRTRGGMGETTKDALGPTPVMPKKEGAPVYIPQSADTTSHLVDLLEKLVQRLEKQEISRKEAEMEWYTLWVQLTLENTRKWSALQKVKGLYFLLKIELLGFRLSPAVGVVTKLLMQKPSLGDPDYGEAKMWWTKVAKLMGLANV